MQSLQSLKQKGRTLRLHLESTFGQPFSLSQAYEALAAMEGAKDWNTLSATVASAALSSEVQPDVQLAPPARSARSAAVFDFDIAQPQNRQLLEDVCADIWAACIEDWSRFSSGREYLVESSAIFMALGEWGVISTGEDGAFCDAAETLVENALMERGYFKQARLIFEGKARLEDVFPPVPLSDTVMLSKDEVLSVAKPTPVLKSEVLKLIEVNLVDVLPEYEVPEKTPEWTWIKEHHSFAHTGDDESASYEFMVHAELINSAYPHAIDIPALLLPFFKQATAEKAVWILFHQG